MTKHTLTSPPIKTKLLPLVILPMLLLSGSLAHAEELSLKVNPSVLQISTQSSSDVRAPFLIENQSDQPIRLRIGYKLLDPEKSKEGKVVFLSEPGAKESIFEHVEVVDAESTAINSLQLGPKQQKQLQVRVQIPENQPSADYYFSLIFIHDITAQTDQNSTVKDRKDQHTISTVQGGIGTNVLLAVGAPETAQGLIEEFSTPLYMQSGPVPITLRVKNSGLHYIRPQGTIMIKNIFGQTVGKVEIPATTVLAGTSRHLLDKDQLTSQAIEAKALWNERFLLGFYSATLSISMAEAGPSYSQTVRFFAFPLHVLLGLIAVITLGAMIYIRVKKKLS